MGPRCIAGSLVRGPDLFGRERDVDLLWRQLDAGSVLLSAPRRFGKSSLMMALVDGPQPGWDRPVYLDVEASRTPEDLIVEMTAAVLQDERVGRWMRSLSGLPRSFSQWVKGTIDEVGVGVAQLGEVKLRLRKREAISVEWRELGEQLIAVLRGSTEQRLIVLDEFPTFVDALLAASQEEALDFLRWFRSVRQADRSDRVRFLVGGSVNLEPLLDAIGQSALINDLQRFRLRPLDEAVAVEFVRAVLATEQLVADPGVPSRVVALVGGVPFFLQLVLETLRIEGGRIGVQDVDRLYHSRVLDPTSRSRFSHYETRLLRYGALEPVARVVLGELAVAPRADDELAAVLLRARTKDRSRLAEALVRLEGDYYVVREEGRWRFLHPVLRDWWSRNASGRRVVA